MSEQPRDCSSHDASGEGGELHAVPRGGLQRSPHSSLRFAAAYLRFLATSSLILGLLAWGAWHKQRQLQRLATRSATRPRSSCSVSGVDSAGVRPSVVLPPVDERAACASGPPRSYHLDAARTNRSPFPGPLHPRRRWAYDAGAPIETGIVQTSRGELVFGTLGGQVIAIDRDGKELWRWDAGERVYATPLAIGKDLIVGSDAGKIVRLRRGGKVRWSLETDGEVDTAPAYDGRGRVVVTSGSVLYALRPNGSVIWRIAAKKKCFSSPAIAPNGTVFFGCQDDRLYGVDPRGRVRVNVRIGGDVDCAPAVDDDGTVFVGSDGGHIVALDSESGKVRWRKQVGGHVRGGLTITRRHTVIAGTYGPVPRVVCLDGKTGKILWRFSIRGTGAREFGIHGSPVEDAAGRLYFGAQDDRVYALSPDGRLLWKLEFGGDVDAPIELLGPGELVVASDDGHVYLFAEDLAAGPE